MILDPSLPRGRFLKRKGILLNAVCALLVVTAVSAVFLVRYWPFSEKRVVATLAEIVPGTNVTNNRFHQTYLPHPGCWAEGVIIRRQKGSKSLPLVTIQKLTIQANYHDLFLRPGHIARVIADGLHIQVPPRGSNASEDQGSAQNTAATRTDVGEIVSTGVVVEMERRGAGPLKFEIEDIKLDSVGPGKATSYSVRLKNPLPPGKIESIGRLGPWNSSDLGGMPLSGTYKVEEADLGVFPGIAGTLSSSGRFDGTLKEIDVAGETQLPDFAVRGKGHRVNLRTRFRAKVNGTNGDVKLTHVNAVLQDTPIQVWGSIVGRSGSKGKFTSLEVSSTAGHVQDILRPFVQAPQTPMSGAIVFRAHIAFASPAHPFLRWVNLIGDFKLEHGRFNDLETQHSVDQLSERSRGRRATDRAPEEVESNLNAQVTLSGGVAKFSGLAMNIPGASAQMDGTYDVIHEKIDFRGTLKTEVKLSDTTQGIKALLLKPFDPLFKRKPGGASIPVEMSGTYSQPHFGMVILPKKN